MNSKQIKERMGTADAFLRVATYLASRPPYKMPLGSSEKAVEEVNDKQIWSRAVTCHMLFAIVFEISIKVIWTLDNHRDCPYTHKIEKLYESLAEDSQRNIEEIYHNETVAFAHIKKEIFSNFAENIQFHSLKEALIANEDTMRNFKYSNKFEGKSSILGSLFWGKETVWALPSLNSARFPEAIYRYAANRVEKSKHNVSSPDAC